MIAAKDWFEIYGGIAIFTGRLLPGVRTFISLPAGIAQYPMPEFIGLTILGTVPWTIFLVYAGSVLGHNWQKILDYKLEIALVCVVISIAVALDSIYIQSENRKQAKIPMKTYRNCILLSFSAFFFYGTFSGLIPLLDPDEPVYGETAKEMLATGDWISPRIYGEFWYDKPPLFYWLEAISFSIFGVSTWAARLPSVLLGALTPCYLFLSSRRFLGERLRFAQASSVPHRLKSSSLPEARSRTCSSASH